MDTCSATHVYIYLFMDIDYVQEGDVHIAQVNCFGSHAVVVLLLPLVLEPVPLLLILLLLLLRDIFLAHAEWWLHPQDTH